MAGTVPEFSAVVLAGGSGARLGGRDKATLEYDGRRLLDRVLDALADAEEVVVAGPAAPIDRPVRFVREDPPSGGPVAGVLAARRALQRPTPLLAVVAVDMPRLTRDTLARLCTAASGHDGAVLVDDTGRRHLAAVLRVARLDAEAPDGTGHGQSWRALLAPLELAEVAAVDGEERDVDTWADLGREAPSSSDRCPDQQPPARRGLPAGEG